MDHNELTALASGSGPVSLQDIALAIHGLRQEVLALALLVGRIEPNIPVVVKQITVKTATAPVPRPRLSINAPVPYIPDDFRAGHVTSKERNCLSCRQPYTPSGNRQSFCSTSCREGYTGPRQRNNRRSPTNKLRQIRCKICGNLFGGLAAHPYCSDDCRRRGNAD